jgi:hypothetical protein
MSRRLSFKRDRFDLSNLSWKLALLKDYPRSTIFIYVIVCNEIVED